MKSEAYKKIEITFFEDEAKTLIRCFEDHMDLPGMGSADVNLVEELIRNLNGVSKWETK